MSTFDAGSIDAKLTVDRSEFNRDMDAAEERAAKFSRTSYSARLELDTARARADLDALEARLKRLSGGSTSIKVDTRQSKKDVDDLDKQVGKLGTTIKKTSSDASQKDFPLMRTAIEQLLPPVVTLASGIAGLSTAAIGFGIAGIAVFKGASAEIKAGTVIGQGYAGALANVKGELTQIEKVGAGNALSGFQQATRKLTDDLPQLNALTATSATNLGTLASALSGALVGSLNAASPLIVKAEGDLVKGAQAAEKWANSNGAETFFNRLSEDLDHALPFLASFGTLVVHTLTAIDNVGRPMLDVLTGISDVLNKIPVGVLTTLATAYIAYRTAVLVTAPFRAATVALNELSAAELRNVAASRVGAAGAGAGAAGGAAGAAGEATLLGKSAAGLSLVLSRAIPVVGVTIAALIGLNALDQTTKPLITRPGESDTTRNVAKSIDQTKNIVTDLFTGHWSFHNALAPDDRAEQAAQLEDTNRNQSQSSANLLFAGGGAQALNLQLGAAEAKRNPNSALIQSLSNQYVDMQGAPSNAAFTADATTKALGKLNAAQLTLTATQAKYGASSVQALTAQKALRLDADAFNATLPALDAARTKLAQYQAAQLQYNKAVSAHNTTAASYVAANANPETVALGTATGVGVTVGAAVGNLTAYQAQLAKVIANEKTWTDLKDKDTIKDPLTGQTYEMKAYDAALVQTNGDQAKAFGLLTGHSQALKIDTADQQQANDELTRTNNYLTGAATAYKITTDQAAQYASMAGISASAVANGLITQRDFNLAVGDTKKLLDRAGPSVQNLAAAIDTYAASEQTAADKGALIRQTLISSQGDYLNYADTIATAAAANQQLIDDFDKVGKGVINAKTGMIDMRNAGAKPLLDDLASLQSAAGDAAQATYDYQVSIGNAKGASKDAADVFKSETTDALEKEYKQLGLTKKQADGLANTYLHWTPKVTTDVEAINAGKTQDLLIGILQDLDKFTGSHNADLFLNLHADPTSLAVFQTVQSGTYAGKDIRVSNANGNVLDYYANGGMRENHVAQIAPAGAWRVWAEPETGGEAYIPLAAAKRPRSRQVAAEAVKRLGGEAVFYSQGGTGGSSTSTVPIGFTGTTTGSSSSSGSGSGSTSSIKSLLNSIIATNLYKLSIAQLSKLSDSALTSLMSSIQSEGSTAVRLKLAPESLVTTIVADNKTLTALVAARAAISTKLVAANQTLTSATQAKGQFADSIRSSIIGAFDIGTSGNGYSVGIKASLDQSLADAQKAAAARKVLEAKGFDPKLLSQITSEGPQGYANLETLSKQSRSYLNNIGSEYEKLYAVGTGVGYSQADIQYNKQIAADQKTVATLTSEQLAETRKISTSLAALQALAKQIVLDARKHGG